MRTLRVRTAFLFSSMFMEREGTGTPGSAGGPPAFRDVSSTSECRPAASAPRGGHSLMPSPWRYEVLPTIDSTNTYAARLPAWTAVRADTQSKGRGRTTDRVWVSDRGGLWLSAVLPCPGPRAKWETLPLVAGQAVIAAVTALGVRGARLRWPNDVMVGTGKLAGLLVERHTADTAVVGIGLNVFNDPAALDPKLRGHTVSLSELWTAGGPPASDAGGGRAARGPWSLDDVAAVVLDALREAHAVLANEGFERIGRALNDAWGEPRLVEVMLNGGAESRPFWFHGVDAEGRLRCRAGSLSDGELAESANPAVNGNQTDFLLLTANDVALFREAAAVPSPAGA